MKKLTIDPKKQSITHTDRLKALSDCLRKYHADCTDHQGLEGEGSAALFFDRDGDKQSPSGYFGIGTAEYYITGDSLEEVLDRIIIEQSGAPEIEK